MWLLFRKRDAEAYAILRQISPSADPSDYSAPQAAPTKSNWLRLFSAEWRTGTVIIGLL